MPTQTRPVYTHMCKCALYIYVCIYICIYNNYTTRCVRMSVHAFIYLFELLTCSLLHCYIPVDILVVNLVNSSPMN